MRCPAISLLSCLSATFNLLTNTGPSFEFQKRQALADELSRILRVGALYEPQRFADVNLSPSTRDLLSQKPQGGDLVRLNRMLLHDAYRTELSADRGFSKVTTGLIFFLAYCSPN